MHLEACWAAVEPEEAEIHEENSDEDAPSEHSYQNTDTEQSDEEIEEPIEASTAVENQPMYKGKDGQTMWYVLIYLFDVLVLVLLFILRFVHQADKGTTKTIRQNIVTQLPGVKSVAKGAANILDCWKLFFPNQIVEHIVNCTNQQLTHIRINYERERDCLPTDFEEMNAFLGLLYLAGVKRAQHLNTLELWSSDGTAPEYFAATMSQRRFHTLLRAIRFDDRTTRVERNKEDNLAAIRYVFDEFVQKCVNNYTLGEYITIDEMLDAFRGRCRFRQYIPNKPAKYGIKIYAVVDARMFYTHNLEIYAGKQPDGPYKLQNDAKSVVKRLLVHVYKTGRNVTVDNYFTSVELANDLYTDNRLTLVGTLRKNKREIPPIFLDTKARKVGSSMFAFGKSPNNCLLTSYIPKKYKNVLMLSTFHKDDEIDPTSDVNKPAVITFYNLTKGAVDVVDRMKSEYSVSRVSNRWPLTVFFSLLNIGGINSQLIYYSNTNNKITRRAYLTELAKQLTKPHMLRRAQIQNLSVSLRQKIHTILDIRPERPAPPEGIRQRKPRCSFCPSKKNRYTSRSCMTCSKPICQEHTTEMTFTCQDCSQRGEDTD